ncbi:unnamed protein product [Cercopithifilaria johnstoni]|uniref:Abnormal cell migration protein 18-like fibronectin type I domain-containing protein n=1 Tax=Cercopithifilaria johnstoni TaxID=2874296 RepID=A0A8J2M254_9BILA|nr:unnamed protein product [Cercopithifilaria johnstoni]
MVSIFLILFFLINPTNGCVHDGKNYKDGDTWVEKDAFIMQCRMAEDGTSWMVEVTGCKTPSGTTIPMNSSVIDGNYEWNCTKNSDGQISMQKALHANAKCGEHERGDQWREKSFLYECEAGGQRSVVGCFAIGDEQIKIGETKEINGYTIKCEKFENGTVVMHGTRQGGGGTGSETECIDPKSGSHPIHSTWTDDNRFNKTCLPGGQIDVLNCISTNGVQIPVNEEKVVNNVKYKCEKTDDGTIRFTSGTVDNAVE